MSIDVKSTSFKELSATTFSFSFKTAIDYIIPYFLFLFAVILLFVVPYYIILPPVKGSTSSLTDGGRVIGIIVITILGIIIFVAGQTYFNLVLQKRILGTITGTDEKYPVVFSEVWKVFRRGLLTYIILYILLLITFFLGFVPFLIAGSLLLLTGPIMFMEEKYYFKAICRSFELQKKAFWKNLAFFSILSLLCIISLTAIMVPAYFILQSLDGVLFEFSSYAGFWTVISNILVSTCVLLLWLCGITGIGLAYVLFNAAAAISYLNTADDTPPPVEEI